MKLENINKVKSYLSELDRMSSRRIQLMELQRQLDNHTDFKNYMVMTDTDIPELTYISTNNTSTEISLDEINDLLRFYEERQMKINQKLREM